MLLTEEEAIEKWCPFALPYGKAGSRISTGGQHSTCFCIASKCMAWRWQHRWNDETNDVERAGYCGLSGKSK